MVERVAVLSDVHANPFALRAVLQDVRRAGADVIVNLGDLLAGPWPVETVEELFTGGFPVVSVRGNGDRMVADAYDQRPGWTDDVPPPARTMVTWAASQIRRQERDLIGSAPLRTRLTVTGLGQVEFFHATARSDEEIVLETTDDDVAAEALRALLPRPFASSRPGGVEDFYPLLAVSGHTHLPTERVAGGARWVNAGSVGKPFDHPSASWMLLGPGVEWRRTDYDVEAAAAAACALAPAPGAVLEDAALEAVAEEFIASLRPGGRREVLDVFAPLAAATYGHWATRSRLDVLDG